jgi:hypothetical protein
MNKIIDPREKDLITQSSIKITKVEVEPTYKSLFFGAVVKNAPNLLSAIPGLGSAASATLQTAIGTVVDYYDSLANERRLQEMKSFDEHLNERLSALEIKDEAIDYWEETIVFKMEDIVRKLISEPGKGFDVLLAEYVASALSDLSTPPPAKDLILSTLLSIDSVDMKVLTQVDLQFRGLIDSGNIRGASYDDLITLMRIAQIDQIMISRSLQRLQAQDLIFSMNSQGATLQELTTQKALLEGEKSPQHYSQGGFGVSAFGRRFLRFLKLSD